MRVPILPNNRPSSQGFTFIELLISMSIMMLVGSMLLVVFLSAQTGTTKSQTVIKLRQKGSYALTQLTKTIRSASEVETCDTTSSEITVTSGIDGQESTLSCSANAIASRSGTTNTNYYLINTEDQITVSSCSFACSKGSAFATPSVSISFELYPSAYTTTPPPEVVQRFTTTVLLRNYNSF